MFTYYVSYTSYVKKKKSTDLPPTSSKCVCVCVRVRVCVCMYVCV